MNMLCSTLSSVADHWCAGKWVASRSPHAVRAAVPCSKAHGLQVALGTVVGAANTIIFSDRTLSPTAPKAYFSPASVPFVVDNIDGAKNCTCILWCSKAGEYPPDRGRQPPMTAVWGGGRTPARGRKTHRTRSSYYFKLPTLYESGDLAENSHAQQMPKVVETATRYLEGGHLLLRGDTWASASPTSDMARSSGFFSFRVSPPLVLRTLFSASTIQPLKDDDEKLSVWTMLNLSRVHLYQVAKWGVARPKMGTGLKALPNRLSLLLAQTWPFLVVSWAAPEPISVSW